MINDQMLYRLHEMKLRGMAEAYKEQSLKKIQSMSFDDRFSPEELEEKLLEVYWKELFPYIWSGGYTQRSKKNHKRVFQVLTQ